MADKERRIVREGNVVHIYQPEGIYTINYVEHETTFNSLAFLEKIFPPTVMAPSQIPDIQGLFMEGPFNYLKASLAYLEGLKSRAAHRQIFPLLEEKRIPIYFAEVALVDPLDQTRWPPLTYSVEMGIIMLEMLTGAYVAPKAKLTRRNFLKIGLASYLALPLVSYVAMGFSIFTEKGNEQTVKFREFSQRIHPHMFFSLTLRELVLAYKQTWLADRLKEKPHFLTVIGAMHSGLEQQLQSQAEERLALLERLRPLWKPMVDTETFYKMVRFDFNGDYWKVGEIIEVPQLKRMV